MQSRINQGGDDSKKATQEATGIVEKDDDADDTASNEELP
jgi:hypothetical protein